MKHTSTPRDLYKTAFPRRQRAVLEAVLEVVLLLLKNKSSLIKAEKIKKIKQKQKKAMKRQLRK